jgi:riboflavin kinase/FMN adenylyltransferase
MESKKIIALGFFDGVHRGHGALLTVCREMADRLDCKAAALTFSSHPEGLVTGTAPKLLNTVSCREALMKQLYQLDTVITLPFDREMMTMPYRTFFLMLVRRYGAAGLVCGEDFRFGNRGEGNGEKLAALCRQAQMPCTVVPQQKLRGIPISSTHIRSLVEAGDMEQAMEFLGHPHSLTGAVVPGKRIGRTLGIPTANLVIPGHIVQPKKGVYACKALVEGESYCAVTNVGNRPTVGGHVVTVEPWLLDFKGDLYGKTLTLEFYKFLRPEKKFDSLEALKEAIRENAEQTRNFFTDK